MNVNRNLVRNWQDDAALERFQMIAPLLDADLDPAKRIQLRRQTAEQNGLSEKTISRYERSFREGGFEGLKPKSGGPRNRNSLPENYDELIEEAKQLRREVPSRSVEKVITILELEGRAEPGVRFRCHAPSDGKRREEKLFQTFLQAPQDDAHPGGLSRCFIYPDIFRHMIAQRALSAENIGIK